MHRAGVRLTDAQSASTRAIVVRPTKSSRCLRPPRIRVQPQRGFSFAMRTMSAAISVCIRGRPGPRLSGSPSSCRSRWGATSQDHPDCQAVYGNGLLEKGETCDDGAGTTRTRPTNADCSELNGAGCSGRRLAGPASLCTAQCEWYEITQAIPGDSCCPNMQDSSTDPDCSNAVQHVWIMHVGIGLSALVPREDRQR